MKYVIISPDTGEHIASISKDALQLASVLTNEHLFDMLKDHTEQRLIDHVKRLNAELSEAVAGISRDEINNVSLQQLNGAPVAEDPGIIRTLELVPNNTFIPTERYQIDRYTLGIIVDSVECGIKEIQNVLNNRVKHLNAADVQRYERLADYMRTVRNILKEYHRRMPRPGGYAV